VCVHLWNINIKGKIIILRGVDDNHTMEGYLFFIIGDEQVKLQAYQLFYLF
jgi:hypothetical protein